MEQMKSKILPLVLIIILTFGTTAFAEHWGELPIKYMTDNGYLQNNGNPDDPITRLDVAKALAKLPLIDKGSNYIFTDTCDADVIKVAKAGIMNGCGYHLFEPERYITREEITKALAVMIKNTSSSIKTEFADQNELSDWAIPYTATLANDAIIFGYEDNTFRPKNHVSRAEFSNMFMKIRDKYSVNDIVGNVFENATALPLELLEIPEGAVGVLSIPSIGINNLSVVEDGEKLDNIKSLAGHFVNTPLFDGNVCISGHNFIDKSPWFGKLANIQEGAIITWKTQFGIRAYAVSVKQNIAAEDWNSLIDTDDNRITLITCLAGQSATHRIMVQAIEMK